MRARHLEPAPAAAERRLDGDRQAVLLGERDDLVGVRDRLGGARHERGAGPLRDVPRGDLVAQVADRRRGRADPDQPRIEYGLGEVRVLRQKAVAGVDRVGAAAGGDVEQFVDAQVGVGGGLAVQRVRLVGEAGVRRVPVGVGVDGDAGQAGVLAGPDDSDGDLAAIGDQYLAHDAEPTRTVGSVKLAY